MSETETVDSACSPPMRDEIASQLDKAHIFAHLFGIPPGPAKIGRFTLLEHVGSGGMGSIYSAYDHALDRKVAIKLVREKRGPSELSNKRLQREAQTLAQLSHPNIVQVYEVGTFQDRVFVAMEFIRGTTLREWLQTRARVGHRIRQPGVLRLFIAAGRGLEAAHKEGLVHRDFKPDNVLIGDDERPRVVDFGLARFIAAAREQPSAMDSAGPHHAATNSDTVSLVDDGGEAQQSPGAPPLASSRPRREAGRPLTTHGRIMGTVAYMAPEQMRGEIADSRSDQFSFCVALYEALYGQRPFHGTTIGELRQTHENGNVMPASRGSNVPAPIRAALLRGLSFDPEHRFPSMSELLEALEKGPRLRRRRWMVAVAAVASTIAGILLYAATSPRDPCAGVGSGLTDMWTPARQTAIRDAFSKTGLPYAAAAWQNLEQRIGAYTVTWGRERIVACEATHVRHEQSQELLDRRMLCLYRAYDRAASLLEQLTSGGSMTVERAAEAVDALPDPSICRNTESMRYGMNPPDHRVAPQAAAVRKRLADARTLEILGRLDAAWDVARSLRLVTESLDYGPVHAEVINQLGRILLARGTPDEVSQGEAMLLEASNLAEGVRHDELVAEIWNLLVRSAARGHADTRRARQWAQRAEAAIQRIGDPPYYLADHLRNLGLLAHRDGAFAEAEQLHRQSLALLDRAPHASRLLHAVHLHDLANAARELARPAEARELYQRTESIYVSELGAEHPYVADLRFDTAMLYKNKGEMKRALELLEGILVSHGATLGEWHRIRGAVHLELGEIHRETGDLDRAYEHAMRGQRIYERVYSPDHARLARAHTGLATIAYRRGAYQDALLGYEHALAIETRHKGAIHIDTGLTRANLAEALVALEQHERALVEVDAAQSVLAPHMASNPAFEAFLASVRGRAYLGQRRISQAVIALETAVRRFQELPGDVMLVERADAFWALVQALDAYGGPRTPRMRDLANQALRIYEGQGRAVHTPATAIRRWLQAASR